MFSKEAEALMTRADEFRRDLHVWYDAHKRLLPWRMRPSVYRTVVSEFMCQQTQVDTVIPYFERWTARWPDFASLAAAGEDEVMKAWEGLGYYSRARRLHELAKRVAALPAPPDTADGWLAMPGVGPYTSAAIASIGYGRVAAVVDGNVVRVLARQTCEERVFKDNGAAVKHFDPLARALVDPVFPGDYNQALMELGATVCYRVNPLCALCPVREYCAAEKRGLARGIPAFVPKASVSLEVERVFVVDESGAVLLRRYGPDAPTLSGLCELPDSAGLSDLASAQLLAVKKRVIANRRYTERIWKVPTSPGFAALIAATPGLFWASPTTLASLALSGPHRKWISEIIEMH